MWMWVCGCCRRPPRRLLCQSWSNVSAPFEWCDFTAVLMALPECVCVPLPPAGSLMTDDAGPAPFARLFIRHVCVGWKLCHPWVFCSAASSLRTSTSLGFNLRCFLCIYCAVFLNQARLIGSSSALGQALTWSLAQAQDTLPGKRLAVKRFVRMFPWYRVCGMKKSVIIAKWKGKGKKRQRG